MNPARLLLRHALVGSAHRSIGLLALALACSACEGPSWYVPHAAGSSDGGGARDAAPSIAERDAGLPDAGRPDAPVCEPETCNGRDDDCDGMIDDGAACPCDVRTLAGRTYLFCAEARTWADASATCADAGYHLVAIGDAVEDAAVYGEIAARAWANTWIGLTDAAAEGTWQWSNGDPVPYEHWDEGEPNDGGGSGEDCGALMTVTGRASEWDDRDCMGASPHVCEAR